MFVLINIIIPIVFVNCYIFYCFIIDRINTCWECALGIGVGTRIVGVSYNWNCCSSSSKSRVLFHFTLRSPLPLTFSRACLEWLQSLTVPRAVPSAVLLARKFLFLVVASDFQILRLPRFSCFMSYYAENQLFDNNLNKFEIKSYPYSYHYLHYYSQIVICKKCFRILKDYTY